jgi:heme A synthase
MTATERAQTKEPASPKDSTAKAAKRTHRSATPASNLLTTADRVFLVIGTLLFALVIPLTWWFALRKNDRERAIQGVRFSIIVIVISIMLYVITGIWVAALVTSLIDALPKP